ncbi:MFS transporter [Natrarchaeobius halalkaliphilus]|uniref:MFS transporter n=2 Tax=Natrarchaeobius halalkaliphilus TaxID=1679091 RepID=A0A3N6LL80_9EURY|nr:MFS transporter [Natrarchaeobius halalkaliphilus]
MKAPAAHVMLALGTIGYVWLMFVWLLVPAFLGPISDEFALSNTQAGLLTGAISFVYIPFALWSGILTDRIGAPRAIGYGMVLFGGAQVLRSVAHEFWSILLLTVLIGVGGTGITFGLPKLVSTLYPPERSGTMSSLYLVGMYAGTAAAFAVGRPIAGPLLGGWRPVFFFSGLAVLAFSVVWFLAYTWTKRRLPWRTDANRSVERSGDRNRSVSRDLRRLVLHRGVLLLAVVGFSYLLLVHGLQNWLTVILQERGLTTRIAVWTTSLFVVAQLVGTLVLPPLSDFKTSRRTALFSCGIFASAGTFVLLVADDAVFPILFAVFVAGFGLGGLATFVRSLPVEMKGVEGKLVASAVGLVFMIGEIGGFVGPLLVGAVADRTGSFSLSVFLLLLGSLAVIGASAFLTHADHE